MECTAAEREEGTGTQAAPGCGRALACRSAVACGKTRCRALVGVASEPSGADALARMCESSWGTVYGLVRRRGIQRADAEDLTQAYFTRFVEKGWLRDASAWRGCLRPFLCVSVRHFLSNHWDRERALKRGGGRVVSLEAARAERRIGEPADHATPETLLERKQADQALAVAFERLTQEERSSTRLARLRPFLASAPAAGGYRRLAAEWGVGEPAVRVAVHRLRRRLAQLAREALAGRGARRAQPRPGAERRRDAMDRPALVRAIVLGAALTQPACTLINYGIGAMVDKGKPSQAKPVDRQDLDALKTGEPVEVHLWDGRVLRGRYQGLQWLGPDQYRPRYEAASKPLEAESPLPALGAGARLVLTSGAAATGEFRGVGPGFVSFLEPGRKEPALVKLPGIASLTDAAGRSVSGARLEALLAERRLPLVTGLMIEQPDGNEVVDHRDVASLSRLVKPHGARTAGLVIGLAADIAWIAVAVSLQDWGSSNSSNTYYTSCPLIDSFDGRGWRLDAEPLGGAIYRAAERTDLVRLDHLTQTQGEYRLRLRNDQREIDHVDALALRVVDHRPGTEVVPDANGRLHVLSGAVAPASGRVIGRARRDPREVAVADALAAADGRTWVSDARDRDPSVPEDLRDGIEIEFPRPATADTAVLVARAGATPLGARVLQDVLALHGRDLGLFYAKLERDPAARAAFERAREREVLPTVRVWDGREWRVAGWLRDLPSLVQRDEAVPLDLRSVPGDVLRLRIDGPPGLWSIDRAAAAFDVGEPFDETRVTVGRASLEDGTEVTDVLAQADGRRHSLRPHMDTVTLAYPAPARRAGRQRTVLVEVTGHYNVMVPADGDPQPEAFRRLVEEPGGFGRFVLDRLRSGSPAVAALAPR
jgi:RNA polymerase sigma factor (sigma-70 family)